MPFSPKDFDKDEPFRIDNPLRDLRPDQLTRRAHEFAKLVGKEPSHGRFVRSVQRLAHWAKLVRDPRSRQPTNDAHPQTVDKALELLFEKAAQVAQNPLKLERLDILSEHEKIALKQDREVKFWNQPKTLRVTVVTLCFSAIIQGWIESGGNGANQDWPRHVLDSFGPDGFLVGLNGQWSNKAKLVYAGVNAIPYLAASAFGCWLSDPLQSMVLGRRGAIFVSGFLCFVSLIGSATVQTWQQLLICRALVGLGMGAKASVTPIFGAETSPSHLRGALVMNWQLFVALGILLGCSANLILLNISEDLRWRLQFAAACIPTACLLTLIWAIPESPRWLLKQGRHREAFKALCSLRETDLQAATELFYANAQLQIEAQMQPQIHKDPEKDTNIESAQHVEDLSTYQALNKFQNSAAMTNFFTRIWQLFRDARTRRATVAAAVVMISQQLCGMNVIIFYSSTLFRDAKNSTQPPSPQPLVPDNDRVLAVRALWLSWGVGLFNFIFTFPAYFKIDTKGRRFLLACTYPGMTLSMMAASLSFLNGNNVEVKVPIFMFLFVFFYSWGQGPVAFVYSSEVFPLINREAGMSFAVFINLLGAGILTLLVPLAQTTDSNLLATSSDGNEEYNISQARLLGIFVGCNVLAMVLIFFFVPETAGATIRKHEEDDHLSYMKLEELNYIFNVPTRKHISYQVRHIIPFAGKMMRWWLCHWFTSRFEKPPAPKKMWHWVEMKEADMKDPSVSDESDSSGFQRETGGEKSVRISQRGGVQIMPE